MGPVRRAELENAVVSGIDDIGVALAVERHRPACGGPDSGIEIVGDEVGHHMARKERAVRIELVQLARVAVDYPDRAVGRDRHIGRLAQQLVTLADLPDELGEVGCSLR
jgi:hypothetical protein